MGYEVKLAKNFGPIEHQRLGLGILAGLVLSLTNLSPSIFYSFPFSNVNVQSSSMNATLATQMTNDSTISSSTIVTRTRTRKFTNLRNIVKMARKSGYEVIVSEAESNVTHFAQTVNTCDVMMGVHGAGLTNFVFLPTNAILIQVVPWRRLDWIAKTYFEERVRGMNLKYLAYRIGLDESTLTELYSRDDDLVLKEMYLVKQNVKLNVRRFMPVLMKALEFLHKE